MKYLMMVTGTQLDYEAMAGKASEGNPAWGEKDIQAMFAHMQKINDDLAETGEMLARRRSGGAREDPVRHAGRKGAARRQ